MRGRQRLMVSRSEDGNVNATYGRARSIIVANRYYIQKVAGAENRNWNEVGLCSSIKLRSTHLLSQLNRPNPKSGCAY
jgi:hypothetical protein